MRQPRQRGKQVRKQLRWSKRCECSELLPPAQERAMLCPPASSYCPNWETSTSVIHSIYELNLKCSVRRSIIAPDTQTWEKFLPPSSPLKKGSESSGEAGEHPHFGLGHCLRACPLSGSGAPPIHSATLQMKSLNLSVTTMLPREKTRAWVTSWAPSSSKFCSLDSDHYSRSFKSSSCWHFLL